MFLLAIDFNYPRWRTSQYNANMRRITLDWLLRLCIFFYFCFCFCFCSFFLSTSSGILFFIFLYIRRVCTLLYQSDVLNFSILSNITVISLMFKLHYNKYKMYRFESFKNTYCNEIYRSLYI